MAPTVFTVGHSSHSLQALVALLRAHGVTQVADVRRWPRSRRHPHFDDDALAVELAPSGIAYAHLSELGGHRDPVSGSVNDGWDVPAFNGYADHLASDEFARGLTRLAGLRAARVSVVMCAEGDWRRCHRQLLADVLVAREGVEIQHIAPDGTLERHVVTAFAEVGDDGLPTYPAQQLGFGF
ncbi:DUF488 domain-containing protein [Baekduia sp. Peel2402]|uniref:DUF488 domain-containing protein n=1 Tax=Baekduia sp. Peel2402 TaxID=3458296 RepID=UPI00403EA330